MLKGHLREIKSRKEFTTGPQQGADGEASSGPNTHWKLLPQRQIPKVAAGLSPRDAATRTNGNGDAREMRSVGGVPKYGMAAVNYRTNQASPTRSSDSDRVSGESSPRIWEEASW
jgi:hypothetical protein